MGALVPRGERAHGGATAGARARGGRQGRPRPARAQPPKLGERDTISRARSGGHGLQRPSGSLADGGDVGGRSTWAVAPRDARRARAGGHGGGGPAAAYRMEGGVPARCRGAHNRLRAKGLRAGGLVRRTPDAVCGVGRGAAQSGGLPGCSVDSPRLCLLARDGRAPRGVPRRGGPALPHDPSTAGFRRCRGNESGHQDRKNDPDPNTHALNLPAPAVPADQDRGAGPEYAHAGPIIGARVPIAASQVGRVHQHSRRKDLRPARPLRRRRCELRSNRL